jgi:hypothetical protein
MGINPPVDSSCPIQRLRCTRNLIDRSGSFLLGSAAGQNREKMAARTEKHKQMPNEVAVAETFVHEKEHTSGIGDATGYQPE